MSKGPVVKMDGLENKDLKGILSRMYKEFYFRPGFALQTLFNIKRVSDISRIFRNFNTLVKTTNFYGKKNNY